MTRWTVFRCLLVLRQGARAHLHEAKQPALTGGEQVTRGGVYVWWVWLFW